MNPYGIATPPAVSPALLALWTAEVARARAAYHNDHGAAAAYARRIAASERAIRYRRKKATS